MIPAISAASKLPSVYSTVPHLSQNRVQPPMFFTASRKLTTMSGRPRCKCSSSGSKNGSLLGSSRPSPAALESVSSSGRIVNSHTSRARVLSKVFCFVLRSRGNKKGFDDKKMDGRSRGGRVHILRRVFFGGAEKRVAQDFFPWFVNKWGAEVQGECVF
eukprot:GEMP01058269.1.p1 GENE.GEMP01058269.1~~GEMP01058269.1.p1  ORF type:complete len:159 (-),score=19.00 GEMP01058269.1:218-694(-)